MIEGAIRHGTTMKVEGNYVDTHGQSEIGFAITRLLGFDLLPRIKQINKIRLYRPVKGQPDAYPQLTPALTRPIRWDLIEQNYDQMIKYATAIRQGTASTEAILRRFTRSASHPTYQAMLEVGRAQRTIFVARFLRSRELQREITEGLNIVEAFNGANSVIYYGKGGEIGSNRQDEQEMTALCLRILQAALVYVNTLMLQDVLAEDAWADMLTTEDRRRSHPTFLAARAPIRRSEARHDRTPQHPDRRSCRQPVSGSPTGARTHPDRGYERGADQAGGLVRRSRAGVRRPWRRHWWGVDHRQRVRGARAGWRARRQTRRVGGRPRRERVGVEPLEVRPRRRSRAPRCVGAGRQDRGDA